MAPLDVFTNAGDTFAAGGGVLGGLALVGGAAVGAMAYKRKGKNKPGKDDIHELDLERLLAPSIKEVKHLLVKKGSTEEATRPYLADALVTRKWLGGLVTTPPVVPLYLHDDANGFGSLGAPGTGKNAHGILNSVCRPAGPVPRFGDGHGLGFMGPQMLVSNTPQITDSLAWRIEVAKTALREDNDGVEPTHEQVREMVSIYDPMGVCGDRAALRPYLKGWDPLATAGSRERAETLALALLATERASKALNAAYFAGVAAKLMTAMLLAAVRGGLPIQQVSDWANEAQDAGSKVLSALAKLLDGTDADPEDKAAYAEFVGERRRVNGADGERSAVWGTLKSALAPFLDLHVRRSTEAGHNVAMLDLLTVVTRPYATLYVVMPSNATKLAKSRPVFTAMLEAVMAQAMEEADRCHQGSEDSSKVGLMLPFMITVDELQNTRCWPELAEDLGKARKYNIRIQWLTQTLSGLELTYGGAAEAQAVIGGSAAIITYAGYAPGDGHLAAVVAEIGTMVITKTSHSKRGDEESGSSSSKERTEVADVARLASEVHADKGFLQLSHMSRGNRPGKGQLRPFIVRQHRGAADPKYIKAGWFVDYVQFARLKDGSAAGVKPTERPNDSEWRERGLKLWRPLAAQLRKLKSTPDPADG